MEIDVNRMFKVLDDLRLQVQDLCNRLIILEERQRSHRAEIEAKEQNREKKFYIAIGIIGGSVGFIELISFFIK